MITTHLEMTDTGSVYQRNCPDTDAEYLGKIDDIDACPWEFLNEWRWLQDEWLDQVKFADQCRQAEAAAYSSHIGNPR